MADDAGNRERQVAGKIDELRRDLQEVPTSRWLALAITHVGHLREPPTKLKFLADAVDYRGLS
jgi:hypothetical protein